MAQTAPPALSVRGLSCGYSGKEVIGDVSFDLEAGSAVVLVGPNGAGKTTFFKTVLGFLPRLAGEMRIGGEDTSGWTRKRFAQAVAYVPQAHEPTFGFSVREMTLMGRTPALASLASPSEADEKIAADVLARLGIAHLAERDYTQLSGGERQLVIVARALAQRPRLLVMDEPCANLDLGNQVRLLEQVRDLTADGLAVALTSHDPNHAFMLGADVVCFGRDGRVSCGSAAEVLATQRLSALYGVPVAVHEVASPFGDTVQSCTVFVRPSDRCLAAGGMLAAAAAPAAHGAPGAGARGNAGEDTDGNAGGCSDGGADTKEAGS